jgi:hypothetical protein
MTTETEALEALDTIPAGQDLMASLTYRRSARLEKYFEALAAAQLKMTGAVKDKRAQVTSTKGNYSYAYSDLESVMEACRGPLNENGIAVIQIPVTDGQMVTVTTIFGHKSGQWIESDLTMISTVNTPQAIGTTISYARRYALQAMAGVASEDDDAAQASSQRPAQRQPARQVNTVDEITNELSDERVPIQQAKNNMWLAMKDKFAALDVFGELKARLIAVYGEDKGLERYRYHLDQSSVKKADEFKANEVPKMRLCAGAMLEELYRAESLGPQSDNGGNGSVEPEGHGHDEPDWAALEGEARG